MADRTTKVTLTAQVAGFVAGMKEAAQATRETGSATEKLAQQQQAFEQMGRASMVAGGLMAVGLGISAKAAIDWDSAWAGVTKTVDGSEQQLSALESGLRDLAGTLPASHQEIAAVAEAAGQLGIQTPAVLDFTRTMIDLGETTNLSADQAATALAQLMNIMGTNQSEVDRLGSTLVALGNTGASTESEILMMAQRIAGAGKLAGATEGEVLGLANALASMGVTAELGGGVASRILQDLYSVVQSGGADLKKFADIAGVSADEFAAKFGDSPVAALDLFAKGLNGVEQAGGNVVTTLTDLGFKSTEEQRVLLQLKGAGDLLTDSLTLQAEAWEENTALQTEAEKRYDTVAAKLDTAKNQVVDMAISIGDHLLPVIGAAADGVGTFADALSGMDGPMGAVVAWGGLIASGILLTGGAALAAIPKIAAYKVALETLNISTVGLQGKLTTMGAFLTSPWGIAMVAGATAVYTLDSAMKQAKASSEELENVLLTGSWEEVWDKASQGLVVYETMDQALEDLGGTLDRLKESQGSVWADLFEPTHVERFKSVLHDLEPELASLARTNLPEAQRGLAALREEYDLNEDQITTLLEAMPDLKNAFIEQASQMDISASESNILKLAMGEIGPAAEEAAAGADTNADALDGLQDSAAATQEAISALADEIAGFGSATFDMREANRALEESYATLAEKLAASGLNFDVTTEAGRQNEQALDSVAEATNRAAAAILENGGSQDAMNAKLAEGRNALIDILAPYYGSRDAAAAYVDQLNLISPQKVTEVVAQTETASAKIRSYKQQLDDIPRVLTTEAYAQAKMDIFVKRQADGNANGGMYAYANGGIEAYANGGFPSGIYKGGTPIHKFAEPETLWEAYISGKPSERDRNRQIWIESGERLGIMKEVRAALSAAAGGGRGVSIGSVQFTQPSQRSQLRDLEDTMHRIERGL